MALVTPAPRVAPQPINYYEAGFNAYRLGVNSFACPYKGDKRAAEWMRGYMEAKRQRATQFNPTKPPANPRPLTIAEQMRERRNNFKKLQAQMSPESRRRSQRQAHRELAKLGK